MTDAPQRGWQRWLWKADASRGQKWLIVMLLVVLLGAMVPILGHRGFVPATAWQQWSLYGALALTALAGWWLRHLYLLGQWRPEGPWVDAGPFKRVGLLIATLLFFVFVLWINLAQTLPMLYTRWWGQEGYQQAVVETKRSSGRHSCRHQFEVHGMRYIFFEFCISQEAFEGLPSTPMKARLQVRSSYFGQDIHGLRLHGDADETDEMEAMPAQEASSAF